MKKGLRSFLFAPLAESEAGYTEEAKKFAGIIEAKPTLDTNDATCYADDICVASDNSVSGGKIDIGIDDDNLEIVANVLGMTITEETVSEKQFKIIEGNQNDKPIAVGIGYIDIMEGGYRVNFYKKVKFKPYAQDSKTKEKTTNYSTPTISGTIYLLADGSYDKHADVDTLENAIALLKQFFVQEKGK